MALAIASAPLIPSRRLRDRAHSLLIHADPFVDVAVVLIPVSEPVPVLIQEDRLVRPDLARPCRQHHQRTGIRRIRSNLLAEARTRRRIGFVSVDTEFSSRIQSMIRSSTALEPITFRSVPNIMSKLKSTAPVFTSTRFPNRNRGVIRDKRRFAGSAGTAVTFSLAGTRGNCPKSMTIPVGNCNGSAPSTAPWPSNLDPNTRGSDGNRRIYCRIDHTVFKRRSNTSKCALLGLQSAVQVDASEHYREDFQRSS